jgi:uncharacterized protein involved in exopolysaccharide biosynthesis
MSRESNQLQVATDTGETGDPFDLTGVRHDVGYILRAPFRHRRVALISFLAVLVVAAASSLVIRDVYQVQAGILALRSPLMGALSNPTLARSADWDAPTRAARETVLRRDNLVALIKQTGFVESHLRTRSLPGRARAWLVGALTGKGETKEELTDGLADVLERRLWVTVSAEGTVTIAFEWPDKELAFQVVEAAVQNFLEARHASEVSVLGETISLLEVRANKLQKELDATLADLERKEKARPRSPSRRAVAPGAPSARNDDLALIESTLNARKRALTDLEAFRVRRMAELQEQLVQKEATFAERHPDVLNARQSIAALNQPSPQVEALRGEVRDLEREVNRRGGPSGVTGPPSPGSLVPSEYLEQRALLESDDVRDVYDRGRLRLLFDQYSSIVVRIDAARSELETTQAAFKYRYSVISPPQIPKQPKKPYLLLRVLGGLLGGLALAVFTSTAMDYRSGRVIEEWQIPRQLGLPVLGHVGKPGAP